MHGHNEKLNRKHKKYILTELKDSAENLKSRLRQKEERVRVPKWWWSKWMLLVHWHSPRTKLG